MPRRGSFAKDIDRIVSVFENDWFNETFVRFSLGGTRKSRILYLDLNRRSGKKFGTKKGIADNVFYDLK